jgi:hypothetical protein
MVLSDPLCIEKASTALPKAQRANCVCPSMDLMSHRAAVLIQRQRAVDGAVAGGGHAIL